jgi:hypothetical protein
VLKDATLIQEIQYFLADSLPVTGIFSLADGGFLNP